MQKIPGKVQRHIILCPANDAFLTHHAKMLGISRSSLLRLILSHLRLKNPKEMEKICNF